MTKQELLEYLGPVCDAENAIYSCNEMIHALKAQKQRVPRATEPAKPTRQVYDASAREVNKGASVRQGSAMVLGWGTGIVVFIILAFIVTSMNLIGIGHLVAIAIAVWLGRFVYRNVESNMTSNHIGKIDAQRNEEADIRHQRNMEQYEEAYKAYLKAKEIEDKAISIIDQNIAKQTNNIARLRQQLDQLYDRNIIYVSFRDIIAVNQIREYLAMGICDALEGANGAYAQYMQDVRINRICTSIDDMKKQLAQTMNAIASSQSALLHEMQTTNNNVLDMQRSISSGLSSLGTSLSEYQHAVTNSASASSARLEGILTDINSATQANAHNQYIAAREANIQGYLLRRP